MRGFACALGLLAAVSACSKGGGGAIEGGVVDGAGVYEVSLDLPDGCPPPVGNEKGVGNHCTMGGNQCQLPLRCACDKTLGVTLAGVPCFCTLFQLAQTGSTDPCVDSVPAGYCGTNAKCCSYMASVAFCVPGICIEGNVCPEFLPPP